MYIPNIIISNIKYTVFFIILAVWILFRKVVYGSKFTVGVWFSCGKLLFNLKI